MKEGRKDGKETEEGGKSKEENNKANTYCLSLRWRLPCLRPFSVGLSDCRENGTEAAKHKVTDDSGVKCRMKLNRQDKHLT